MIDYFQPDLLSSNDYSPFGTIWDGRTYGILGRMGFNNAENDGEISGEGNVYDYGFRIYNPRLGKFLSVDPLAKNYPWYTPYQFAGNTPIQAIDIDGKEEFVVIHWKENGKTIATSLIRLPDYWKTEANSREIVYVTMNYRFFKDFVTRNPDNTYKYDVNDARYFFGRYFVNETNRTTMLSRSNSSWKSDFDADEKSMITEGINNVSPSNNTEGFEKGRAIHTYPLEAQAVQFATNSATLTQAGINELNNLAYDMKLVPNATYTLEGHTDNVGDDDANLTLSVNRVTAAKNYLISQGIDASRITIVGKGETQPIGDNSTDAGKAKNRRVEMIRNNPPE
ncbi:hypothetical protein BH10BAC1_BH10BAC1_21350 [soil metagenome]